MVFRNNYKEHMDNTMGGWKQRREVGMAGGGVVEVNADNCI